MKRFLNTSLAIAILGGVIATPAFAAEEEVQRIILQNVNIFNGTEDTLYENYSVLNRRSKYHSDFREPHYDRGRRDN